MAPGLKQTLVPKPAPVRRPAVDALCGERQLRTLSDHDTAALIRRCGEALPVATRPTADFHATCWRRSAAFRKRPSETSRSIIDRVSRQRVTFLLFAALARYALRPQSPLKGGRTRTALAAETLKRAAERRRVRALHVAGLDRFQPRAVSIAALRSSLLMEPGKIRVSTRKVGVPRRPKSSAWRRLRPMRPSQVSRFSR